MELLIFDFDGLIIDTETPDLESWQEMFAEHGCHLSLDAYAHCIGAHPDAFDPCAYLEEMLGHPIDREDVRERRRRRFYEMVERQPVLPGIRDYLTQAPEMGVRCSVASSAPRSWVAGHLERVGLIEHFSCIRCSDEVPFAKPHPALFLSVLETLGVPASKAVVLEDSPNGITAARAAGIFSIAIPNPVTAPLCLDGADLKVDSLDRLPLRDLVNRFH